MDAVRGLLDELMGKDRNLPAQQRKGSLKFSDPSICKFELCGLCPNSLFKNTRSDLGPCKYEVHADHLDWERIQGDWNKLPDKEKASYGYDKELYRYLDELVRDMDRKVRRAKDRADKENAPKDLTPAEQARLDDLHARMKEALDKSQKAGEDGDVDMSMLLAQQAETLKADYAKLEKQLRTPDRTMTVCEVCGVFINSTDNDQRKLVSCAVAAARSICSSCFSECQRGLCLFTGVVLQVTPPLALPACIVPMANYFDTWRKASAPAKARIGYGQFNLLLHRTSICNSSGTQNPDS